MNINREDFTVEQLMLNTVCKSDDELHVWSLLSNLLSDGPRFVDIPGDTAVDEGELAQLQCSADGNPPPTIKWTRIGSRATLSTMQRLQFDSVQESDIGVYVCEATVEGFEPVTSYGRVDINSRSSKEISPKFVILITLKNCLEFQSKRNFFPPQSIWGIFKS